MGSTSTRDVESTWEGSGGYSPLSSQFIRMPSMQHRRETHEWLQSLGVPSLSLWARSCLLLGILPDSYYMNYCKLVHSMRIMNQHRITKSNIRKAYLALTSFAQEFELLYCQWKETQIHFVRPCLHSLVHLPTEVVRFGPPLCSSQWTLERTIGNLGEEIKQHSNPFANLSQ